MRIGMISQWYDPEEGSPAVAGAIARSLVALGHDVHVLTGFPNYPIGKVYPGYRMRRYQYEHRAGVHVHRVPLVPSHDRSALRRAGSYLSFAASASTRLGLLRSVEAWLVYSTPATVALPAMLARAVFRRPYVLLIQDLWPDTVTESGFLPKSKALSATTRGLHAFCDASYRHAAAVAVTSPGMAGILIDRGVPAGRLSVVPNWVDETIFRPVRRDKALAYQLGIDGFVVMYAGSLGDLQGLDTVVEAAGLLHDLSDVQFVFVGSGVAEPRLRAAAEGLDNVIFLGRQPVERMADLMAISDVQLVSLKDLPLFHSTLPSKVQAALASGRVVLGSVPGDAGRLIERSGAGLAVQPGNAPALADAVRRLHAIQPHEREAMGGAGRQFYLHQLSEQVGSATLADLLQRAASGRPPLPLRESVAS
jgi:colanic acid biosynthesis glycosyl transferase WcaI